MEHVYAMETQTDNQFTFTWNIENFSMCYQSKGEWLSSPKFALNSLPDMKWYIQMYPKGKTDENYIALFLIRDDNLPESCSVKHTVQGLDCNGKLIFTRDETTEVFQSANGKGHLRAFKRKTLFRFLKNDILVIKYILKPVCEINTQIFLPELSYKNGLFADVVLRAGETVFKVHKAMLYARWKALAKELDEKEICEKEFDIAPNVLDNMLKYVYTGEANFIGYEFFQEMSAAAAKYGLWNLSSVPVISQICRTRINTEKVSFEWPIVNFSTLSLETVLHYVFTVGVLKKCKWNLSLHIRKIVRNDITFDIFICKPDNVSSDLILVKSKICDDENKFHESSHLFEGDQKWKCAEFSRNISTNPKYTVLLKCEFNFSDCTSTSEIIESSFASSSSITCYYNINSFQNLYENGTLSDVNIIVDSVTFPAHKFILASRSSVFSRMFENRMIESEKKVVKIPDFDSGIIAEMLWFMYTGNVQKPLDETAVQLYAVADKYDISALKEMCLSFLKKHLDVRNVCKLLSLADMHSDADLYKNAFEFFCSHAEDVFSTTEWKEISNANLYIRVLENFIHRNKSMK